jgi:hypothetical protein
VSGTEEDAVLALLDQGPLNAAAEERAVPQLNRALRDEYERLFALCKVRPERTQAVDTIVDRLVAAKMRYAKLETALGMPWYIPAVIHSLESGQRFDRHLHNGDPLTNRTTHVPAGRPPRGNPPFTVHATHEERAAAYEPSTARTAAVTSAACSALSTGLIGSARCVRASSSVTGSATPSANGSIAGWRWTGVR